MIFVLVDFDLGLKFPYLIFSISFDREEISTAVKLYNKVTCSLKQRDLFYRISNCFLFSLQYHIHQSTFLLLRGIYILHIISMCLFHRICLKYLSYCYVIASSYYSV